MVEPFFWTVFATSTPMYVGTVATGDELFPLDVVHGPPHETGGLPAGRVAAVAKPFNAAGADPPESAFAPDHWAPHQLLVPPDTALTSPSTNAPLSGNANVVADAVADDGR